MRKLLKVSFFLLSLSICVADSESLGTLSGLVKFPGETPPRNMFANISDRDCPPGIPQTHLLVKQDTLGLQNVLVILERQDRRVMPTRLQAQLAMKGCQLLPRLQWVPLGTSLLLVNQDGAKHHVHAYLNGDTVFEADLSDDGSSKRRPLVVPGLYKINCDKHLWERAWIYVSPHDSVALTDAQGQFTIRNIPSGRYQVHVWHEGWRNKGKDRDGRLEFQPMEQVEDVKVRDGKETEIIFDALSPAMDGALAN